MGNSVHYSHRPLKAAVSPSSLPAGKALNPRGASGCPAPSPARDTDTQRSARDGTELLLAAGRYFHICPIAAAQRRTNADPAKVPLTVLCCCRYRGGRTRLETAAAAARAWMHHVFVCVPGSVSRRHRSVQQHQFPRTDPTSSLHLQRRYSSH